MEPFLPPDAKLSLWPRVNTIVGTPSIPDQDADLMLRVGDGDEECFGVLLDRHRNSLVHFLFRMVQEQPVAEELAQEVFLRIYRSRAGYEATARFTTWMFRIATHVALNWLRDERHQRSQERLDDDRPGGTTGRELSDPGLSVEQRMLYEARLQEVRDAIATLPERQRAAVLMHKYQEMEYSQIANVLEISELAVKSLLFRAYQTLRARLAYMVTGDPR